KIALVCDVQNHPLEWEVLFWKFRFNRNDISPLNNFGEFQFHKARVDLDGRITSLDQKCHELFPGWTDFLHALDNFQANLVDGENRPAGNQVDKLRPL